MDFELDDDQLSLQSAAADVLAKECPPSYIRAVAEDGRDTTGLWETMRSLDWPTLAVPAEHGGVGASTVELAIVLEQLGYVADPTPFLATTTQFIPALLACGAFRPGVTGTVARLDGARLAGTASYVLDADRVDEIAVLTTEDVFVVPAAATTVTRIQTMDPGMHVTTVTLDGVTAERVGPAAAVSWDLAITGMAAVMVGACQRALDITLEYVRGREQFDVPIGSFQAVKHKAVDMHLAVERARALVYFAALAIAEHDDRGPLAASMAKAAAGDAQRIVFQHAIQLHGGIGYTWENDLHLYLRRAKVGELLLGGAAEHRRRVGRAVLACA